MDEADGMSGRAYALASTRLFWQQGDPYIYPYEVSLYFDRLGVRAGIAEGDAHGRHGSMFSAVDALAPRWTEHFRKAGAEWLRPYLERVAFGEEVAEQELVEAFARLHGREPMSWPFAGRSLADELVNRIESHERRSISGSVAVWGAHHGRPFNESRAILSAYVDADGSARLKLDGDQRLIVWGPQGFTIGADGLVIAHADRVRREFLLPDLARASFKEYTVERREGSALLRIADQGGQLLDRGDPGDAPAVQFHAW